MSTILVKRSTTAGAVPTAAQLVAGELALNVADSRLFHENNSGVIVELGMSPAERTKLGGIAAGAQVNAVTSVAGNTGAVTGGTFTTQVTFNLAPIAPSFIANSVLVARGGAAGSEGGQVVLGYGNALANTITWGQNSTWNIDVAGAAYDTLRMFSVDSGGIIRMALQIPGSTGIAAFDYRPTFAGNLAWDAGNFDPSTKANSASPALTGTPTAPTAAPGTNTTQIATTAFVEAAKAGAVQVAAPVMSAPPIITTAQVDQDGCVYLSRISSFTNGSGNDSVAMQVALDAIGARPQGGRLVLPAGGIVRLNAVVEYNYDSPISITSESGRRGCTIDQRGAGALSFTGSGPSSNLAVFLEGICFQGNAAGAASAVALNHCENIEMQRIRAAAGSGAWYNFFYGTNVRTSKFRDWYVRGDHGLGTYADKVGNGIVLYNSGTGIGSTDNQFNGILLQGFQAAFNFDGSGNPGNEGLVISDSAIVECGYGILWRHTSGGGYVPPMCKFMGGHMNVYRMFGDFANVAQVDIINCNLELNSQFGHSDIGVSFATVTGFRFCNNYVSFTGGNRNTVALSATSSVLGQANGNSLNMRGSSLGMQFLSCNAVISDHNSYTRGNGTGTAVAFNGGVNYQGVGNIVW